MLGELGDSRIELTPRLFRKRLDVLYLDADNVAGNGAGDLERAREIVDLG